MAPSELEVEAPPLSLCFQITLTKLVGEEVTHPHPQSDTQGIGTIAPPPPPRYATGTDWQPLSRVPPGNVPLPSVERLPETKPGTLSRPSPSALLHCQPWYPGLERCLPLTQTPFLLLPIFQQDLPRSSCGNWCMCTSAHPCESSVSSLLPFCGF